MTVPTQPKRGRWWTGLVQCRVCGHKHVAVAPACASSSLECAHCGSMACDRVIEEAKPLELNEPGESAEPNDQ